MCFFVRMSMEYAKQGCMLARKPFLILTGSHAHTNKGDGRKFERGTVHVQVWKQNKDGTFIRINDARSMSNAEMKKYGPILKDYCPSVKFR